jgi:hypothetical protein
MLPLAHVGHWAIYVLYGVPVAIVLVAIAMTMIRDRRERRSGGGAPPDQRASSR